MINEVNIQASARPFDPHRRPASDAMNKLVHDVMLHLKGYELYHGTRARKRSATAQATYQETVEAVICDLIHRELEVAGGQVHVSQSNQVLRKKSRYKGRAMGKTLPDVLKAMSAPEMGFVSLFPGKPGFSGEEDGWAYVVKGRQTVMAAGSTLLNWIKTFAITIVDIGRSRDEEVIILRGQKDRSDKPGGLVDYTDTDETNRMRKQLEEVNDWLANADIECDAATIDPHDRRLRRIFNNADFCQGGRLFGGFWQAMGSNERLSSIIIDDDSVVELDYGQMGLMLLYGLEKAIPPEGDLYDLTEYGIPASCRPGIKKVIQAAINASKPLDRMPKGARKKIPKRYSLARIMEALTQRHPAITRHLGSGIGMRLMRLEADILLDVLLTLKQKAITALPIHDAVVVNAQYEDEARSVMIEAFQAHTGLRPEVSSHHP